MTEFLDFQNATSKRVIYDLPTAIDNYGEPTVTCTPETYTEFEYGPTEVTCTAIDGSKHETDCQFFVDVRGE